MPPMDRTLGQRRRGAAVAWGGLGLLMLLGLWVGTFLHPLVAVGFGGLIVVCAVKAYGAWTGTTKFKLAEPKA